MACQVGALSLHLYIFYHLHFYFQCYGRFPFELEYNTIVSTLNRHGDTILLHNYMKSYRAFSYARNNNNKHGASLGDAPWLAESVGGARAGNLNVVWPLLPTFWHQYTFFFGVLSLNRNFLHSERLQSRWGRFQGLLLYWQCILYQSYFISNSFW